MGIGWFDIGKAVFKMGSLELAWSINIEWSYQYVIAIFWPKQFDILPDASTGHDRSNLHFCKNQLLITFRICTKKVVNVHILNRQVQMTIQLPLTSPHLERLFYQHVRRISWTSPAAFPGHLLFT